MFNNFGIDGCWIYDNKIIIRFGFDVRNVSISNFFEKLYSVSWCGFDIGLYRKEVKDVFYSSEVSQDQIHIDPVVLTNNNFVRAVFEVVLYNEIPADCGVRVLVEWGTQKELIFSETILNNGVVEKTFFIDKRTEKRQSIERFFSNETKFLNIYSNLFTDFVSTSGFLFNYLFETVLKKNVVFTCSSDQNLVRVSCYRVANNPNVVVFLQNVFLYYNRMVVGEKEVGIDIGDASPERLLVIDVPFEILGVDGEPDECLVLYNIDFNYYLESLRKIILLFIEQEKRLVSVINSRKYGFDTMLINPVEQSSVIMEHDNCTNSIISEMKNFCLVFGENIFDYNFLKKEFDLKRVGITHVLETIGNLREFFVSFLKHVEMENFVNGYVFVHKCKIGK